MEREQLLYKVTWQVSKGAGLRDYRLFSLDVWKSCQEIYYGNSNAFYNQVAFNML